MTGLEKALWIPTGALGVATVGLGINWTRARSRFNACADQPETWLLQCLGPGIDEAVAKRFLLISGVLTAIAATAATGVYVYRRKRR